jgi:hypothetical protein
MALTARKMERHARAEHGVILVNHFNQMKGTAQADVARTSVP